MTANAMKGDREACLEAGMDDYLSKPVRLKELQKAIEKWGLERQRVLNAPEEDIEYSPPSMEHNGQSEPIPEATQVVTQDNSHEERPIIDPYTLQCLKDMCQVGSGSQLGEIIEMFISDTRNQIEMLTEDKESPDRFKHLAHSLKGSCLMVGANSLADICLKIEKLGKEGRTEGIDGLLDELKVKFSDVEAALDEIMKQEAKS
jgi:HPt (histidine-containing phosphotransfer) domain-containing protein